jgi:hypothetical protein
MRAFGQEEPLGMPWNYAAERPVLPVHETFANVGSVTPTRQFRTLVSPSRVENESQ